MDDQQPNQPSLLTQLQKRKVFRAAVAYGVVAFVVVQVIDAVGGAVGVRDETVRWILACLVVGFPIVATFAWYFEVSKPSIHLDERFRDVHFSRRGEFVVLLLIFIVAAGLAGYVYVYSGAASPRSDFSRPVGPTRAPVIAVLPFLTTGTPNSILGEGLPDQLLTRLDKLTELNVISRTSSFSDRFKGKDVGYISKELGADYIIEGSSAQDGSRVIINVQLIRSSPEDHVWSKTYDRQIDNILDLEVDIAQNIAQSLSILLSNVSKQAVTEASTTIPQAYDLNLQGWSYYHRPRNTLTLQTAVDLFDKAIALDPGFEDPVIGKCQSLLALYRVTLESSYMQAGVSLCETLSTGEHRSAEVNVALGDLSRARENFDSAVDYYARAILFDDKRADAYDGLAQAYALSGAYAKVEETYKEGLLNASPKSMLYRGYGYYLSMRGRHAEAGAQFERAVEFAPDDTNALSNLGLSYFLQDRWAEAEEVWRRALAIRRDFAVLYNMADLHYYTQRYDAATAYLEEILESDPGSFIALGKLASLAREAGDVDRARRLFEQALRLGEPSVTQENRRELGRIASYHANLGDYQKAYELLGRIIREDPESPSAHYYLALTKTLEGKRVDAQSSITKAREFGYSAKLLQLDPVLNRAD